MAVSAFRAVFSAAKSGRIVMIIMLSAMQIVTHDPAEAKKWNGRSDDEPSPGFDETHFFWLTNDNPFPPVEGWIRYEDPYEPHSGFLRRILVFGMKGHGKSILGNYLLGNSPIAWPYSKPGTYFETRKGPRNMTGFLGRSKGDLNSIRIVEMPGLDVGQTYGPAKRREIKSFFRNRDDFFHIFCWVKNASNPRFTRADAETFDLLEDVYGPGIFNNMLIMIAGYNFSLTAEAELEHWDSFRQRKRLLLQSMFPTRQHRHMPAIPISGFNPMCDIFDFPQHHNFVIEQNSMAMAMDLFKKTPILRRDIASQLLKRYLKDRDNLRTRLNAMKEEGKPENGYSDIKAKLTKRRDTIKRLKYSMSAPWWREELIKLPKSSSDRKI